MIASYMDSTNLRPEATRGDITELCEEAVRLKLAAVCINPSRLKQAIEILNDSQVNKCTVIGFPLGAERLTAKYLTARESLLMGANELDMVINVGAFKEGDYSLVENEIKQLNKLKNGFSFLLKVIVETALLNEEELMIMTKIISDTEADFIKTSTGFSTRGASLKDIAIINRHKSDKLKIKASGGIRTLASSLQFIAAGVHRIGSSNAGAIVEEYRNGGGLLRK